MFLALALALLLLTAPTLGAAAESPPQLQVASSAPKAGEPPPDPREPQFVHMKEMVIPVLGKTKVKQFVRLFITLEVPGFGAADTARSKTARLTDRFITVLYGAVHDDAMMSGELVNITPIKQKLLEAGWAVLGRDGLTDVLIQGISHQRQ